MTHPPVGREARPTLVRAARAVDAARSVEDAWVLLEGDTITAVGSGPGAPVAVDVVDLGDATLVPGFVDLHGHGGATQSYEDDSSTQALAVHRAHGTTRSVLSLVANPIDSLVASLDRIRAVMADDPLVLGAHLEGPFLSPDNRGAHEASFLVPPTPDVVDTLLEAGDGVLRQVTIAPELPHALLGMKLAEKYKEKPDICNAIGAHHDEQEATSMYAPIVQVCDAISGARPGARREVVEAYIKRLNDLERLALSYPGVVKTYAIQAGRELRVIVGADKISDAETEKLSNEIAQKIQDEMTYPGQVRITVIRETRAVSFAK